MAFPTVQTADTQSGTVTSNSTSWTLTYPTNLASGDLIFAAAAIDGVGQGTFPSGFYFPRNFDQGAVAAVWGFKISDGTETGDFTMSVSASEQGSWRIFRITGWFGSGLAGSGSSTISSTGSANGTGMAITVLSGASSTPDSASLDPSNWATEDTLWITTLAADTSRTVNAYPTNCPDLRTADVSGGANGATLGIAMASSAVSSFNPDAFTISASDDWVVATIAIRPAAFVYQPRHGFVNHQNPGVV